jgi:DNA-directed RNA polymerase II subunit RPB3
MLKRRHHKRRRVFDFHAKPRKFYFEVETDGSLGPQEIVMKVLSRLITTSNNSHFHD